MPSFDIVSEIDKQEIDNAINQARKELATRFDFKGSTATIEGSEVEGSNADIADQFSQLIVTQQAYSANTKVITTANDMVQDLLNVLR